MLLRLGSHGRTEPLAMSYSDWIFPRLEGNVEQLERDELEKLHVRHELVEERIATLSSDKDSLSEIVAAAEKLFDQERARKASIDTRLISIIGLVSVAGTVVLSALFSLAAGTLPFPDLVVRSALSLSCLYLALQLFAALLAATSGVMRASYPMETTLSLLPRPKVSLSVHLRERISQLDLLVEEHRTINNRKLSLLAVAHVALKNFLHGLLLLAFLAAVAAMFKAPQNQPAQFCSGPEVKNCISIKAEIETIPKVTIPPPIAHTQFGRIITVGPFPEGNHQLNRKTVQDCITKFFEGNRDFLITGWQVIGRVDKRQLRSELVPQYGSNQSLAMSRAAWVHDEVLSKLPNFDSSTALVSIGGATSIGKNVTDDGLRLDRVVDIYALWQSSGQLRPSPARPVSATCAG